MLQICLGKINQLINSDSSNSDSSDSDSSNICDSSNSDSGDSSSGDSSIVTYFSKNNLTPQQQMRYSQGSFSRFSQCLVSISPKPCFRGVTKHNSDEVQNSELLGNTKSHRGKKCLITRICLILSDIPLPVFPGLVFIE